VLHGLERADRLVELRAGHGVVDGHGQDSVGHADQLGGQHGPGCVEPGTGVSLRHGRRGQRDLEVHVGQGPARVGGMGRFDPDPVRGGRDDGHHGARRTRSHHDQGLGPLRVRDEALRAAQRVTVPSDPGGRVVVPPSRFRHGQRGHHAAGEAGERIVGAGCGEHGSGQTGAAQEGHRQRPPTGHLGQRHKVDHAPPETAEHFRDGEARPSQLHDGGPQRTPRVGVLQRGACERQARLCGEQLLGRLPQRFLVLVEAEVHVARPGGQSRRPGAGKRGAATTGQYRSRPAQQCVDQLSRRPAASAR